MVFPYDGTRWSCNRLISFKNQWLITVNDIVNTQELRDIAYRENSMDKCSMNPLTHYIVINKLSTHKHLEILQHPELWAGIDEYHEVRDLVINDLRFNYITNFDEPTMKDIIEIIRHAFIAHGSENLICDHISNNMQKIDDNGIWHTVMEMFYPCIRPSFNDIKLINWKQNVKNFHAFYQKNDMEYMIIMIYNILNEVTLSPTEPLSRISDDPQWSIIMNTFSDDFTEYLFSIIIELKNSESDDERRNEKFDVLLRVLLRDDNAFGFIGKNETFLIYHQTYETERFQISVNCKLAAKIGEWCAAVFIDQKGFYAHYQQTTIERMSFKDPLGNGITVLGYGIPN